MFFHNCAQLFPEAGNSIYLWLKLKPGRSMVPWRFLFPRQKKAWRISLILLFCYLYIIYTRIYYYTYYYEVLLILYVLKENILIYKIHIIDYF